jgi:hypothetical protein
LQSDGLARTTESQYREMMIEPVPHQGLEGNLQWFNLELRFAEVTECVLFDTSAWSRKDD